MHEDEQVQVDQGTLRGLESEDAMLLAESYLRRYWDASGLVQTRIAGGAEAPAAPLSRFAVARPPTAIPRLQLPENRRRG
jgi:hypothetical protein